MFSSLQPSTFIAVTTASPARTQQKEKAQKGLRLLLISNIWANNVPQAMSQDKSELQHG